MVDKDEEDTNNNKTEELSFKREALNGHTALCLMSLLGFVLYTATYSVVYMIKTQGKPVAVLDMWMVLTHLFTSILTCAIRTMTIINSSDSNSPMAEAQSAIFLAVALSVTGIGTGCLQENLVCLIYYPAAALPQLAAAGSIAWAWVMYVASLGCQIPSDNIGISLGLGNRGAITTVSLMGLVVPQIISALGNTCDKWKGQCSQAACNVALNISLVIFALILSHAGHWFSMPIVSTVLHLASVIFIWIELLVVVSVGKSATMNLFTWSMGILTVFPILSASSTLLKSWIRGGKRHSRKPASPIPVSGIHFPLLNLYNSKQQNSRYHIL